MREGELREPIPPAAYYGSLMTMPSMHQWQSKPVLVELVLHVRPANGWE